MGASATARSTSKRQPEPEINVTPLVDVVLVLLIIFMVVTPALAEGEQIVLPEVQRPDEKPRDMSPIDVALTANGKVLLDKRPIAPSDLEPRLAKEHAADPKRALMLKADAALPWSRVRDTFAMVQAIGFKGVALKVTEQKTGAR